MPDTYAAYKDQRYRWVYGAMQILKRHGPMLFGRAGKLTLAQRYHFVAGWLPWFADAFALIFSVLAVDLDRADGRGAEILRRAVDGAVVDGTCAVHDQDDQNDRAAPRRRSAAESADSLASAVTGLSLAYIVGKGVLFGLVTSSNPFVRTPKCEDSAPFSSALRMSAAESLMLLAIAACVHCHA